MERLRIRCNYPLWTKVRWGERPLSPWVVVAQRYTVGGAPPPMIQYGLIHHNIQHRSDMWEWSPAKDVTFWQDGCGDGEWHRLKFLFRRGDVVWWKEAQSHPWEVVAQRWTRREISPEVIDYGLDVLTQPTGILLWAHEPTLRLWSSVLHGKGRRDL